MSKPKFYDARTGEWVTLDSMEELATFRWLQNEPRILSFCYHPNTYVLTSKAVYTPLDGATGLPAKKPRSLLKEHVYTPDFSITFPASDVGLVNFFKHPSYSGDGTVCTILIDVKGTWNPHGGDREFSLNQKMMYALKGLYVFKFMPKKHLRLDRCNKSSKYSLLDGFSAQSPCKQPQDIV